MAQQPIDMSDNETAEATYGVNPAEEISEIADYSSHNMAKVMGSGNVVSAGEKVAPAQVIKPADLAFKPKK